MRFTGRDKWHHALPFLRENYIKSEFVYKPSDGSCAYRALRDISLGVH